MSSSLTGRTENWNRACASDGRWPTGSGAYDRKWFWATIPGSATDSIPITATPGSW